MGSQGVFLLFNVFLIFIGLRFGVSSVPAFSFVVSSAPIFFVFSMFGFSRGEYHNLKIFCKAGQAPAVSRVSVGRRTTIYRKTINSRGVLRHTPRVTCDK